MTREREIRASFDRDTILMYQAYSDRIADAALAAQRFVTPFSFHRMTWIKPSFLWLMHRSNWGRKSNQQRTLAVRIHRSGWDKALSLGMLTHPEPSIFANPEDWDRQFQQATVHVQWDTERSLRGAALNHYSIQVGISRHLIREFVDDWIVGIEDRTAIVDKIRSKLADGDVRGAKKLIPSERPYPVDAAIGHSIHLSQ